MRNVINQIKFFFKNNRKTMVQALILTSYIVALLLIFVIIINLSIVAKTNDNIYSVDEMIKIPDDFDCILILGAGIKNDGSPTDMLYDRLMAGYEAHKNGKSKFVFITGDSERKSYTETVTMERVLNENGIDSVHIISDGYGLSTYESIWRAKNVYGFKKVLIVSQKYHLHRSIYIAQELGLEAYGLDGALREYRKQPIYSLREYLARIKDMIYSEICPNPTYKEKWEVLDE